MIKPYYTLVGFCKTNKRFEGIFGDYNREVEDEKMDYLEQAERSYTKLRVITTSDAQPDIDKAISVL